MNKNTVYIVIVLLAFTGLLLNQKRIDRYHKQHSPNRIVNNPDIPPSLSVSTIALGPLRSLVANALWWRAMEQQNNGEYFDALQLADWITKMQPTYPSVWVYLGWNMAYNIAHDFAEPDDRWQWILRAIKLLRDEGLKYNPNDTVIRHELARMFYDRIGGKLDPAAELFKNNWAFLMMEYFDSGDKVELEKLQRAAKTIEELRIRPGISEYSEAAIKKGIDVFDFEKFPPKRGWLDLSLPQHQKVQGGWEIYYAYKRQRIESELKMDIDRILFIDTEYGPLDWRLHQAHTMYWAAEENFEDFAKSGINFARIVRQSMIDSFYEGRLFFNPTKNIIVRTNNLKIMGRIHDYFDYYMKHHYSSFVDGLHKQFLEQAVTILYTFNHLDASHELFGHYQEDYLKGKQVAFEDFVQSSMEKTLAKGGVSTGRSLVQSALFKSFEWLELGEDNQFKGYFNLAKLIWTRHQNKYRERSPAKLLPPFNELVLASKQEFLSSKGMSTTEFDQSLQSVRSQSLDEVYIGDITESHRPKPNNEINPNTRIEID